MAGIKCINCNFVGTLENQGITFDGKTGDMQFPVASSTRGTILSPAICVINAPGAKQ